MKSGDSPVAARMWPIALLCLPAKALKIRLTSRVPQEGQSTVKGNKRMSRPSTADAVKLLTLLLKLLLEVFKS